MDLKGFVEFLTAYPAWAKVAVVFCLAVAAGVLVLAKPEKQKSTSGDRPVLLTIERVSLFPDDPSAQVKILAHVNGIVFEHPSVGGVEWMKVGPAMSEKVIALPPSKSYEIRFEAKIRGTTPLQGLPVVLPQAAVQGNVTGHDKLLASQTIRHIWDLPHEEEYRLYNVDGEIRDATPKATVKFRLSR